MSTPAKVPGGEVAVYEATDGSVRVDVRLEKDTVWLTQRQMAELFESSTENIGLHLKKIFADNELQEAATTEDFSVVQSEGSRSVRRRVKHYNLDAIISVGYRINSHRGVRFRQWATTTLREHLVRGYTLNRQRFQQSAAELETTLALVRRAASGGALTTDQGRGLVDVIAVHKAGKAKPDPLRGLFEASGDGKAAVVEYERDSDLRDAEQVPLRDCWMDY
jgi:predicted XRE-type DNA-binding protein